ncbi:hypothetical protein HYV49_04830 [Candidatus Pacearchaeota archaeon]|nr:hypothetical protein [Candidatus Pacearchaeota archaeon]
MNEGMRIYYDEELDYLTIFIGESRPNYGEDITPGVTIFKDQYTDEIIGIGIQEFKEKTSSLQEIELKLPFKINFVSLQQDN